jgi:hypothetical protein
VRSAIGMGYGYKGENISGERVNRRVEAEYDVSAAEQE